jgi:2-dehydro-3-deoxy-D-arabinonate dehydratase
MISVAEEEAMRLIRFRSLTQGGPQLGVLEEGRTDGPGSGGTTGGIGPVTALAGGPALSDLLALPLSDIREVCEKPSGVPFPPEEIELLAPVDGRTEVWAAGVTYERSRAARVLESEESADVYDRVYAAERPELFFKSAAWRVRGPGRAVSVRADSGVDVLDPEMVAVLNDAGEVVG